MDKSRKLRGLLQAVRRGLRSITATTFANSTAGQVQINGVRIPPTIGTSRWYICDGESFSEAQTSLSPRHVLLAGDCLGV